ncbi:LuxR family transcriptional regulator [Nocardioides immobilis]|uniref:LuxR family transcriptional regulator n=1 Tax=Nocardioides immobilis TaxID=2049295 RepID=A0A417XZL4_9ACTN|nr:LuxR family transcriptional regulator [Nocardioides immobilis]
MSLVVCTTTHALAEAEATVAPGSMTRASLVDATTASSIVLAAARGSDLLVDASQAPEGVRAQLLEDLRRIGEVRVDPLPREHPTAPSPESPQVPPISQEARELLELLADGLTLGTAAERLNLSRRTADRRLASARRALGARTTAQAIAAWRAQRAGTTTPVS